MAADGDYDTRKCHDAIASTKNAKPWMTETAGAAAQNEALCDSKNLGGALWRRWSGHHRPEPRRDEDSLCRTDGARPVDGARFQPLGRRVSGQNSLAQWLHRARHPRRGIRGISPSRESGASVVARFVQQS